MLYHLAALHGNIKLVANGIDEDPDIVHKHFQYSDLNLVEDHELLDGEYVPPLPIPRLVRIAVYNHDLLEETVSCNYEMFGLLTKQLPLDRRWLIAFGFGYAPLLHYACAGNQLDVVKLLLSRGSNPRAMNAAHHTADKYTTCRYIRELLQGFPSGADWTNDKSNDKASLVAVSSGTQRGRSSSGIDEASRQHGSDLLSTSFTAEHKKVNYQLNQVFLSLRGVNDSAAIGDRSILQLHTGQAKYGKAFSAMIEPSVPPSSRGDTALQARNPTTLETMFPATRRKVAAAPTTESPLQASMETLFRKLVPLHEVASRALLGRDAAVDDAPIASNRIHPSATDCHLLNKVVSSAITVHRDQEDELDQVIDDINLELKLRDVDQQKRPRLQRSKDKVTSKELIWHRAGVHLDSPMTGRIKEEHARLKQEALHRGLHVLQADRGSLCLTIDE